MGDERRHRDVRNVPAVVEIDFQHVMAMVGECQDGEVGKLGTIVQFELYLSQSMQFMANKFHGMLTRLRRRQFSATETRESLLMPLQPVTLRPWSL